MPAGLRSQPKTHSLRYSIKENYTESVTEVVFIQSLAYQIKSELIGIENQILKVNLFKSGHLTVKQNSRQ